MEIMVRVAATARTVLGIGPSVILLAAETGESIPVVVGPLEVEATEAALKGIPIKRPMTHDLMKNLLEKYAISLKKVVITDLQDHTFYALLHLESNGEASTMDCRPSDAIALALRTNAPIYVESVVLEKVKELQSAPAEGQEAGEPQAPDLDDFDWRNIPPKS